MVDREIPADELDTRAGIGSGNRSDDYATQSVLENQGFAVRWLRDRYGMSSAAATTIAEAAGLGPLVSP